MYKVKRIEFIDHPVMGNLTIDFCDNNDNPVDTVIIAGENGCGKSTVLQALYGIGGHSPLRGTVKTMITDGKNEYIIHQWIQNGEPHRQYLGQRGFPIPPNIKINTIYSDVEIVFSSPKSVNSVTSVELDSNNGSRKSDTNLPREIKQMLVDIQSQDDAQFAQLAKENPEQCFKDLNADFRMHRFTRAFRKMFEDLNYSHIENRGGNKAILFKKGDSLIPIDDLSSGEKQIVYRGCFLLKDINALNGALVFIDEPEISLHPTWQMKVMDYYKGIFTNEEGVQTSQIFAVTHSPFIIHNENRRNDKVIVLARDADGKIIVKDKPEYFRCDSLEAVRDAFSIEGFSAEQSTVYLEGRTDEKYFNRALEVYGLNVPFKFKWVGHIDEKGQEVYTGHTALDQAFKFLVGRNLSTMNICLYDSDTNRVEERKGNVFTKKILKYESSKGMKKGIENALILDSVNIEPYYKVTESEDDYGGEKRIKELKKMELCEYICSLSSDELKPVFANLKTEIESLVAIFEEG